MDDYCKGLAAQGFRDHWTGGSCRAMTYAAWPDVEGYPFAMVTNNDGDDYPTATDAMIGIYDGKADEGKTFPVTAYTIDKAKRLVDNGAPQWRKQFPDMESMPYQFAAFQDVSWHNDACPCFEVGQHAGRSLRLWVDYADIKLRESTMGTRYLLQWTPKHGSDAILERPVVQTDDIAIIMSYVSVERLAARFSSILADDMEPDAWRDMRLLNQVVSEGICASHDYRDANEDMAQACEDMGLSVFDGDHMNEETRKLWNAAWHVATPHWLTAKDAGAEQFDNWRCSKALNPDTDVQTYEPGEIQLDRIDGRWIGAVGNLEIREESEYEAECALWDWYARHEHVAAPARERDAAHAMAGLCETLAQTYSSMMSLYMAHNGLAKVQPKTFDDCLYASIEEMSLRAIAAATDWRNV